MNSQAVTLQTAILQTDKVTLPANGSIGGQVVYTADDATIMSVGFQNIGWTNGIWPTQCFVESDQVGIVQVQTNNSSSVTMYFFATLLCTSSTPQGKLTFKQIV